MFLILNVHDGGESYPIATASSVDDKDALCALLEECMQKRDAMRDTLYQWKEEAKSIFSTDGEDADDSDRMSIIVTQHIARKQYFEDKVHALHDSWLELVILQHVQELDVQTIPHYTTKAS